MKLITIGLIVATLMVSNNVEANYSHQSNSYHSNMECLVQNIYRESRGESYTGRLAVAFVTFNRAKKDINNLCSVVYQSAVRNGKKICQFSWVCEPPKKVIDFQSYQDSREIANLVVGYIAIDPSHGATHFHTTTVHPKWDKAAKVVAKIGHHIFLMISAK